MIHRTLLGSMERFVGGLIEHYAGAFPVWLAPVQAVLIPITDDQVDYAETVAVKLKESGLRVDVDAGRDRMQAKIRNAQLQKTPFMLVIGKREAEAGSVSVRARTGDDFGAMSVDDVSAMITSLVDSKAISLAAPPAE
ncbi:hypothetical protein BH20CHL4_BH20CHL4_04610 [soil metagenome]